MANFEFLTQNFINTSTMVTAGAGSTTFSYLFDRNEDTQFASVGYSATNFDFSIKFDVNKNISKIALKNINWKNFKINIFTASIDPIVNPTSFAGESYWFSVSVLNNTNFVIAYRDTVDANKGKFTIYTQAGVQVVASTEFESGLTSYASIAVLSNTNFVIAYSDGDDGSKGKFVIYTQAGVQVVAPTEFESGIVGSISITVLSNTNFAIAYSAGGASKGYFVIYTQAGVQVVAPTEFEGGGTSYVSMEILNNTNFAIAYSDGGDANKGKFTIYTEAGVQVVAPTEFEGGITKYVSIAVLNNTNFVIAYSDGGDTDKGKFTIYTEAGVQVIAPKEFESGITSYIATVVLSNTIFVIIYTDDTGAGAAKIIQFWETGDKVTDSMIFTTIGAYYPAVAVLNNTNFVIAYADRNDSNIGKYTIYPEAGAVSLINSATNTSSFSTNSDTSLYLSFSTLSADNVYFFVNSTTVASDEKKCGELYIGDKWLTLDYNPDAKGYKPKRENYEKIHTMSDGGVSKYVIAEKFNSEINLEYITSTTQTILLNMYRENNPINFVPKPTSSSWGGDIFEMNWIGSFDFEEYQTNVKTLGFKGKIKLQETPR